MSIITINESICEQCGICIETCPLDVISMDKNGFPSTTDESESHCVQCGHCEAVCPPRALKYNTLPEMRTIEKDKPEQITSDNLSEYFRSRRSIRKYLKKAVEKEKLEQIFNVVNYSPTGVNQQQNKWIVISNRGVICDLSNAIIRWMKTMVEAKSDLAQYLHFDTLIDSYEKGDDIIFRNAPTIVIGYTDAAYTGGIIDTVIATSHLELLLPSFGLGGCWAGFAMIALGYSPEVKKTVGLDDSQTVRSAMMVGYPKYRYYKIPYRKESQIKWM